MLHTCTSICDCAYDVCVHVGTRADNMKYGSSIPTDKKFT